MVSLFVLLGADPRAGRCHSPHCSCPWGRRGEAPACRARRRQPVSLRRVELQQQVCAFQRCPAIAQPAGLRAPAAFANPPCPFAEARGSHRMPCACVFCRQIFLPLMFVGLGVPSPTPPHCFGDCRRLRTIRVAPLSGWDDCRSAGVDGNGTAIEHEPYPNGEQEFAKAGRNQQPQDIELIQRKR